MPKVRCYGHVARAQDVPQGSGFETTLRYRRLLKGEGWKGSQGLGLGLRRASRMRVRAKKSLKDEG